VVLTPDLITLKAEKIVASSKKTWTKPEVRRLSHEDLRLLLPRLSPEQRDLLMVSAKKDAA
jgi:hypothetical protein